MSLVCPVWRVFATLCRSAESGEDIPAEVVRAELAIADDE
jgi:hypothetical protein